MTIRNNTWYGMIYVPYMVDQKPEGWWDNQQHRTTPKA